MATSIYQSPFCCINMSQVLWSGFPIPQKKGFQTAWHLANWQPTAFTYIIYCLLRVHANNNCVLMVIEKSAVTFQYTLGENASKQGFGPKGQQSHAVSRAKQSNSQLATVVSSEGKAAALKRSLQWSDIPKSWDTYKHPSLRHAQWQVCHSAQVSSLALSCVYCCFCSVQNGTSLC